VPPQDLTLPLLRDIGWYPDADVDGFADDATNATRPICAPRYSSPV